MSKAPAKTVLLCNGAKAPRASKSMRAMRLEYRPDAPGQNMNVSLPAFERKMLAFPPRILDLLEIAAYVFCADRLIRRGARDDVEFHTWSRSLEFRIAVRDAAFWRGDDVRSALDAALQFMSGDRSYSFIFEAGHATPPATLFTGGFVLRPAGPVAVTLFSGGLDSLAGAIDRLNAGHHVCLVSHRSNPGTIRTQKQLLAAFQREFPKRVTPYGFDCTLNHTTALEETQRTRAFIYTTIGFAVAHVLGERQLFVFENGVTSVNFRRREDQGLARASRTTHPKTMRLMERLFALVLDDSFQITQPFLDSTKPDVLQRLTAAPARGFIDSTVSCSQTRRNLGFATHCGTCYQCVDRRVATFAAGVDDVDAATLYATDFLRTPLVGEAKTIFVDYVRQALAFREVNIDHFYNEHLLEFSDITDGLPNVPEHEVVERVYALSQRHGEQVVQAIQSMVLKYDDPGRAHVAGSALDLIAQREHLKTPVGRLIATLVARLEQPIHRMFAKGRHPEDENDFNQKVGALISTFRPDLASEHPTVKFACAGFTPDHELLDGADVLIESKFLRRSTTPGKIRDPISADITNTPPGKHLLVLVFDPEDAIVDRATFQRDFESRGQCTLRIIS